jgi:hypothetical protein
MRIKNVKELHEFYAKFIFYFFGSFLSKIIFYLFGSFLHNCMSGGARTQILPLLLST